MVTTRCEYLYINYHRTIQILLLGFHRGKGAELPSLGFDLLADLLELPLLSEYLLVELSDLGAKFRNGGTRGRGRGGGRSRWLVADESIVGVHVIGRGGERKQLVHECVRVVFQEFANSVLELFRIGLQLLQEVLHQEEDERGILVLQQGLQLSLHPGTNLFVP